MLLEILKNFVDEVFFRSDSNTAMYIIFAIKSFFSKLRLKVITLERNIFNYWEVIIIGICNDFLDGVCKKIYERSLIDNSEEYQNIIRYVNNEYFLDSFNCGSYTSLLSSYSDFVLYEKKSYISILSNIGYMVFNYFEITNFMEKADMPILERIAINIGLIITVSQILFNLNTDKFFDVKKIEKDVSLSLFEFSSNIFIINESDNVEDEIKRISNLYENFISTSIESNYLAPYEINSDITTSSKFQSYFLSLIFSFTKHDFAVSETVSSVFLSDLETFKYYLYSLINYSMKRKIYDTKLLKCLERKIISVSQTENIFSLTNISISFNNIDIIKDFTYNISMGNWISIYGESGCGKTTLCNLILGRNQNYEGNLTFCGEKYDYFDISKHVSFVSPSGGIFKRSVRENCTYGIKETIPDEKIREYLNLFDMNDVELDSQSDFLSTGQKQRIKIIRLLLHDRSFFFLDEITSNLDEQTGKKVMKEIRRVSSNKIVISITHNKDLIESTDRILRFEGTTVISEQ